MKKNNWKLAKYLMLLVMILFVLFHFKLIEPFFTKPALIYIKGIDTIKFTFIFYILMAIMVISFMSILVLNNKVSSEKFGLTFPWKQFKAGWFIVICVLWILPNTIDTHWEFPVFDLELILAVFMAPIIEELIFRGYLQGMFPNLMIWKWAKLDVAVVLMSVLFALWHFDNTQPGTIVLIPFLLHFMGGISLGTLRNQTGSVWLGVIAHALGNLIAACHGLS